MDKEIYVENLGKVKLKISTRARYMRLKVSPKDGITAILPENLPEKYILKFIHEKRSWLQQSMKRQEHHRHQFTVFTHDSIYRTRSHILYLKTHAKNTIRSVVAGNRIVVWYPVGADVQDESQEFAATES